MRRAPSEGRKVVVEVYDGRGVVRAVVVQFRVAGQPVEVAAGRVPGSGAPARWEAVVPRGASQEVRALAQDEEKNLATSSAATLTDLVEPLLPVRAVEVTEPGLGRGAKIAIGAGAAAVVAGVVIAVVLVSTAPRVHGSLGRLDLP